MEAPRRTTRAASSWIGRWNLPLAASILLPVVYLYLRCFQATIIDDAYITLQYAETLRDHGHWGFFPDRISNSATSPLNVVLTALVGLFVKDMVAASVALAALEATALILVLRRLGRSLFDSDAFALVSSAGLLANPLLLSTLGLESLLYALGFTTSLLLFVRRRWVGLAVVLALLTLTRPDGVLLCATMIGVLCIDGPSGEVPYRSRRRLVLMVCVSYAACLLPWYLYSWIALGSLVPDTFFLKVATPWGVTHFLSGLPFYLSRYPLETISSFWLAPLGLLVLVAPTRRVVIVMLVLLVYDVLYFGAYARLKVAPYHWYFAPLATSSGLLGALGIAALHRRSRTSAAAWRWGPVLAASILAVSGLTISLVRMGALRPAEAPIHTNWASPAQYEAIGRWLHDHLDAGDVVHVQGEIGTIAYFAERRLIDAFSCREDAPWIRDRFGDHGSFARALLDVNFLWFEPGPPCGRFTYDLVAVNKIRPDDDLPADVIRTWPIESRWVRRGRVMLVPRGPSPSSRSGTTAPVGRSDSER